MFLSVNDTGGSEKNPSSPNRSRTYDLLVTSPDALPLSYSRLVGAKAIKLGSCDKFTITFIYHCEYATYRHFILSSMQDGLSHEPSLMAFAPTSLLYLSDRASGLVTKGHRFDSKGTTRIFFRASCVIN